MNAETETNYYLAAGDTKWFFLHETASSDFLIKSIKAKGLHASTSSDSRSGQHCVTPMVEITKAEYDALQKSRLVH